MPLCGSVPPPPPPAATHDNRLPTSKRERLSHSFSAGDIANRNAGKAVSRKVVVIGDGACGKSLLNVFVNGEFPSVYEPTVFENHVASLMIDSTPLDLALWDTAGQEDFARLRSLSYSDTHVVLVCFSVDQRDSLENVEAKWMDEILEHCPGVKLCLVALKCDLRERLMQQYGGADTCVTYEQGLEVARRIRASRYLECSAKEDRGVREAFEEAARVSLGAKRRGETRGSAAGGGQGIGGGGSLTGLGVRERIKEKKKGGEGCVIS